MEVVAKVADKNIKVSPTMVNGTTSRATHTAPTVQTSTPFPHSTRMSQIPAPDSTGAFTISSGGSEYKPTGNHKAFQKSGGVNA
jgi:hypothetical protein